MNQNIFPVYFLLATGAALLLAYSGLLLYYAVWWQKGKVPVPVSGLPRVPISVIVAARNEEKNIGALLEALSQQTYPPQLFEVVVVDDHSTDNTATVIQQATLTNLRLVQLQGNATASSKKKALAAGIAAAKNNHLLITDADCVPGKAWIETLAVSFVQQNAMFIAAPVAYRHKNNLLGIFQTLDFITLQGITAAGVASGLHSMCNGANLGYTKNAFNAVQGFSGVDALASGDDMLLMHKIKTAYPANVNYLKTKDAIVYTHAAESWSEFVQQRIRWGSKTTAYQDKSLFWALVLVYLLNVWFVATSMAAFFYNSLGWPLFLALVWKTIMELLLVYPAARFFNKGPLVVFFPLLQPLHILYTVIIGALSQKGTYQWKGRATK